MADVVNETIIVNDENATANATARIPSTPEGMAVAYGSLVIMAVLPIFFGAFRSVRYHKEQKDAGEKTESMSQKDAAMFPVIASVALFGLYIFFQVFSKEYINLLLTGYFFFLGILALTHILSPFINRILGNSLPVKHYHLIFSSGLDEAKEDIINYKFDNKDLVCLGLCSIFGAWYLWKKHWIANNIFGLAFAINGVELLHLNNIATGCILLGGLFVYDIFWVFGTDVMVTVAKSFEAPIKLVFPQDLLERGFGASNFAMLGLGDIVIPGIFIALLLRFDVSMKRNRNIYFHSGMVAYLAGLLMTIFVMHVFKHAQPALLYLVPACIGAPLFVALIRGELKVLFQYEDNPSDENEQKVEEDEDANEEAADSKKSD